MQEAEILFDGFETLLSIPYIIIARAQCSKCIKNSGKRYGQLILFVLLKKGQISYKKLEKMLISPLFKKNCSTSHSYLHNFFPFSAHYAIAYHWHHSNQIGKKIRSNHEISNPDCTKVIYYRRLAIGN